MSRTKSSVVVRLIAIVIAVALVVPVNAGAETTETVQPRGSYYIQSFCASVYAAANGKIQVWFDITGCDILDSLGALWVQIYRSTDNTNWTFHRTFTYQNYPELLASNDFYHSGHVEFQGTIGMYYRAYVCFYGGSGGTGDTRYYYTSPKMAVVTPS